MNNIVEINNLELLNLVKDQLNVTDVSIRVKGKSMRPFLKNNVTIVTLTKPKNIKKLDIVLYKVDKVYVLHRIIKINDNIMITQGDGLVTKEKITRDNVIGVVKFYEHHRKLILTSSKLYLLKVRLWLLLRPFRRILLKLVR